MEIYVHLRITACEPREVFERTIETLLGELYEGTFFRFPLNIGQLQSRIFEDTPHPHLCIAFIHFFSTVDPNFDFDHIASARTFHQEDCPLNFAKEDTECECYAHETFRQLSYYNAHVCTPGCMCQRRQTIPTTHFSPDGTLIIRRPTSDDFRFYDYPLGAHIRYEASIRLSICLRDSIMNEPNDTANDTADPDASPKKRRAA